MPGPKQVYVSGGKLLLFVRTERRPEDKHVEHLFVGTERGVVFHHWLKDLPPELELVNDTAGRGEAVLAWREVKAVEAVQRILIECLKTATSMLDDQTANELRKIYKEKVNGLDLVQR